MHYLHILTMHIPAGLENRAFRFINTASGNKHSLLVISRRINRKFTDRLHTAVEINHWKYWKNLKLPRFLRSTFLKKWLKARKFDVFISYSQLSYPKLWDMIFKNTCAKAVYYEGGSAWVKSRSHKKLLERFNAYIANSAASALMLENKFGIKKEKIKIIHNGLPKKRFENIENSVSAEKEKGKFVILFLGRLIAIKGINSLIRAMKYLDNSFELWIVGEGKAAAALEKIALKLGVKNRVVFKGVQVDPAPFIKAADVMAVPSVREAMPNVVLEAGAAARTVIASDIDGIPDIIDSGINGILLKPSVEIGDMPDFHPKKFHKQIVDSSRNLFDSPRYIDPEVLAQTIKKLKADPGLRKKLGKNLYNTVKSKFMMEDKIKQIELFIETLL